MYKMEGHRVLGGWGGVPMNLSSKAWTCRANGGSPPPWPMYFVYKKVFPLHIYMYKD